MVILEIIMIVIGLGAVVMSYRITDQKKDNIQNIPKEEKILQDSPAEIEQAREEMEHCKEDVITSAEEELSRLSNDKLMGMNEYSEEVLNRMAKNHEEVVFLYDMLKEKEEDIKDLVHHVDSVKAMIHDETAKEYQKMMDALKLLQESRITIENGAGEKDGHMQKGSVVEEGYLKSTQAEKLASNMEQQEQHKKPAAEEKESFSVETSLKEDSDNHNTEIIHLYKKGYSVLEISKMLSLGQGEVKFVIDLYENR